MATLETLSDKLSSVCEKLDINKTNIDAKLHGLEETLNRTSLEIKESVIAVKNHVMNLLYQETRHLRQRVSTLEDRLLKVERQVNRSEQNTRKYNFEIDGIPSVVPHEELAPSVVKIFNAISERKINVDDVEAVHRIPGKRQPNPVIVRMKRNLVEIAHQNRKKLKGMGGNLDFPGSKIFINHNLSPNMRAIDFEARKLLKAGLISGAWFGNGSCRIKCLNGKNMKLDHERDLYEAFPQFDGFNFDTELFDRVINFDMDHFDDDLMSMINDGSDNVTTL